MEGLAVKKVLIAGGTGLIGAQVVAELAKHKNTDVVALVRRPATQFSSNVTQVVVDFNQGLEGLQKALSSRSFDVVICAIGTTMRTAGSKEAFTKIDHDIPVSLLKYANLLAVKPKFIFVSSLGADKPYGFYLETKQAVEKEILAAKLPYVIVRPSLLLGERPESRLGEAVAQKLMPGLFNSLAATPLSKTQWFKRYRPVTGTAVAKRIVTEVFAEQQKQALVLEGDDFACGERP